jgi:aspartate/methionine/tyrosine aminotransferase
MPAPPGALFPYMFWAHEASFASAYCLAQSGMPIPDLPGLRLEGLELLGYPTVEAQPALEARLAELYGLPQERVLTTVGASGGMHLAAQRWMSRGVTLVETPSYEPLRVLPRRAGGRVLRLERRLESGWSIDPEQVARLAAEAGEPCHLFITNPHNPSGAVLDGDTIRALAAAIEPGGGVLVCCEAYMEYAPKDELRCHAAHLAPNGVSISTLTKAYGLGALRVGWMLLGEDLAAEREHLVDLHYLTWVDPPTPSLVAGRKVLDRLPELLAPIRRVDAESRPHLDRWLRSSQAIEATVPPFGILSFPRVRGVEDTAGLARFLAEDFQVDVVPGEAFDAPGYIRVACGVPEATMVEGLVRLENGIRAWLERA